MTPTHHTPANDNAARPEWYDRAVTDHLPFLNKIASRYVERDQREDLVNDSVVLALRKWPVYDRKYKFATWLAVVMRTVNGERKRKARTAMRTGHAVSLEYVDPVVSGGQEQCVDLASALEAVPADREGDMLLRRCMGDTLVEIGADYGLTRERVRQLSESGRRRTVVRMTLAGMRREVGRVRAVGQGSVAA